MFLEQENNSTGTKNSYAKNKLHQMEWRAKVVVEKTMLLVARVLVLDSDVQSLFAQKFGV